MRAKQWVWLGVLMVVGVTAGAGAGAAYYWHQATALPEWHSTSTPEEPLADQVVPTGVDVLQTKLATGEGVRYEGHNRVTLVLSEAELNQLIVEELAKAPQTQELLRVAQNINTTLEGDRIKSGFVINPTALPTQNLPPQAQQAMEKALAVVPRLGDRPLYLGLEGRLRIDQGRLVLADDTRLQVGRINLTLADVAQLTGLDPAQLTEQLNLALPQTGLTLDSLEVTNGEALLRGQLTPP